LARFIVEGAVDATNRGDFVWKWQRQPRNRWGAVLDAFFEKCFGDARRSSARGSLSLSGHRLLHAWLRKKVGGAYKSASRRAGCVFGGSRLEAGSSFRVLKHGAWVCMAEEAMPRRLADLSAGVAGGGRGGQHTQGEPATTSFIKIVPNQQLVSLSLVTKTTH
jgi:hypothetical protein